MTNKILTLLVLFALMVNHQALAQSSAQPIQLGYLSTDPTVCKGINNPCWQPYSVSHPLPITGASSGSGTVSNGTINQLAWYAATGSTLVGLGTTANAVLITNGTGAPSESQTLPSAVQGNITQLGTLSSPLGVTSGGTGTATQFTQGSAVFAGASGVYSQDNANFFYDATNHRLGIGSTIPAKTLDVVGTGRISTSLVTPILVVPTDGIAAMQIMKANGTTPFVTLDSTNGRMGINTTPGSFALNVNGSIQAGGVNINVGGTCIGNTTNGQQVCFGAGTGGADNVMLERAASGTVNIGTDTAGAQRFNVIGSGSISGAFLLPGIATSSAAQTGTLCGGAAGNITLDTTTTCLLSSLRFKKDIKPLDVGLNEVMKMKPVSFVYKDGHGDTNLAKRKVGLIAEDVDLIDKRLVSYEIDGVTPHSIMYAEYTAVLTQAIQDQQKENSAHFEILEQRLNHISEGREGYRCFGVFYCKEK